MIIDKVTNDKRLGQLVIIIFFVLLFSCTSSIQVLKPTGDLAIVTLETGSELKAELLSVKDESVIVEYDNNIYKLSLSEIHKLFIQGYSLLHKKALLLGTLSILDIYFIYDNPNSAMKVIYGLLIMGKLACILGGDLEIVFTSPIFWRDLDNIRIHCRYPQGLDTEQWNQLLQLYGQTDFLNLADENN